MLEDHGYPYHQGYQDDEHSKLLLYLGIQRLWADDTSGQCYFLLFDESVQVRLNPVCSTGRSQWMLAPAACVPRRGGAKADTGMEEGSDFGSRLGAPWED